MLDRNRGRDASDPPSRWARQPVVTIGGVVVPEEDVLFSGLSVEFVGLNVISIRVPGGVAPGNAVPIVIRMDELESRRDVTIAVD